LEKTFFFRKKRCETIFCNNIVIFFLPSFAQEAKLFPENFRVTGDAVCTGEHCYRLTKAEEWQGGTLWYKNRLI
jgi:hypothetical protein